MNRRQSLPPRAKQRNRDALWLPSETDTMAGVSRWSSCCADRHDRVSAPTMSYVFIYKNDTWSAQQQPCMYVCMFYTHSPWLSRTMHLNLQQVNWILHVLFQPRGKTFNNNIASSWVCWMFSQINISWCANDPSLFWALRGEYSPYLMNYSKIAGEKP